MANPSPMRENCLVTHGTHVFPMWAHIYETFLDLYGHTNMYSIWACPPRTHRNQHTLVPHFFKVGPYSWNLVGSWREHQQIICPSWAGPPRTHHLATDMFPTSVQCLAYIPNAWWVLGGHIPRYTIWACPLGTHQYQHTQGSNIFFSSMWGPYSWNLVGSWRAYPNV